MGNLALSTIDAAATIPANIFKVKIFNTSQKETFDSSELHFLGIIFHIQSLEDY